MKMGIVSMIVIVLALVACDRVGSEAWCKKLEEKPKGQWTLDETGDFTKYCILGMNSERW